MLNILSNGLNYYSEISIIIYCQYFKMNKYVIIYILWVRCFSIKYIKLVKLIGIYY